MTSYVLITGPGTFFDQGQPPGAVNRMMKDNPECFLLVETTSNKRNWAAPGDLSIEKLSLIINDLRADSISSNDPHGPAVFFSTGETRRIKSIQLLRNLISLRAARSDAAKANAD